MANDRFIFKNSYLFWLCAVVAVCFVFSKIHSVLLPFYIAFIVVMLFNGIVNRCEKKLHLPRAVTSGIITAIVCFFLLYLCFLLTQFSFNKATSSVDTIKTNHDFITTFANNIVNKASAIFDKYEIDNTFNLLAGQFSKSFMLYVKSAMFHIFGYFSNIISTICLLALTPIVIFMSLKDMPKIKQAFFLLLPIRMQKEMKRLFYNIHDNVFNYLEGQSIAAIVLFVCYSVILFFLGVEHFLLFGIVIGFSSFIPYVGFYSATAMTLFSVYNQTHNMKQVVIVFIATMVMQIVDSGFITPKIVGNKLGVHPLAVIFGVLVSVPLFGIIGMLLSLPIIAISSVVIRYFVGKYKSSDIYNK